MTREWMLAAHKYHSTTCSVAILLLLVPWTRHLQAPQASYGARTPPGGTLRNIVVSGGYIVGRAFLLSFLQTRHPGGPGLVI